MPDGEPWLSEKMKIGIGNESEDFRQPSCGGDAAFAEERTEPLLCEGNAQKLALWYGRGRQTALLFLRELEDITHQQIGVVFLILREAGWRLFPTRRNGRQMLDS